MKIPRRRDDDEERHPPFGLHLGDLGVVVIAALCTLALILILIMPSPMARYEKAQAQKNKPQARTAPQNPPSSGEVSVRILPPKQH